MKPTTLVFLVCLPWLLLAFSTQVSGSSYLDKFPSISITHPDDPPRLEDLPGDLVVLYYNQTLDHFNYKPESYANFTQKYILNPKYWGGPNTSSPIIAYLGEESELLINPDSFFVEMASCFKALLVYIEHRYYGVSIPNATELKDDNLSGYFNSAQALADYAEVLLHVRRQFDAHKSPILVTGGSYGGMLAAWFRLKYPHIAFGALASSAPLLYFDNITPENGYYSIVTKDFKGERELPGKLFWMQDTSESCYETIRDSWHEMYELYSTSDSAQYDYRVDKPGRVEAICDGIDGAPNGTGILDRISAGMVAYLGNKTCYNTTDYYGIALSSLGWSWQTCTEMVMPIGRGHHETMFPPKPFNLTETSEWCQRTYNVTPRPHWVTTYYGGHDIETVLKRFGSNIIFSNGLRDPYSIGGVLKNISDSLLAITTDEGSHCTDIGTVSAKDPDWLFNQRQKIVNIIQGWFTTYYADHNLTSPTKGACGRYQGMASAI
ncbi:Lysosomal Pro-Xaa carboxypeptidase [Bertholletia excelsa]